jgi:hypothetical protein
MKTETNTKEAGKTENATARELSGSSIQKTTSEDATRETSSMTKKKAEEQCSSSTKIGKF